MTRQKVLNVHVIALSICLLIISIPVYAATTGKIAGSIIDSQTGALLPGANVFIDAKWIDDEEAKIPTVFGAASDYQGDYYIINISPGTYTVVCQMIGYATQKIEKVLVYSNRTTSVDFEMSQSTLEMEEVVVTAQREVIKQDVSASKYYITAEKVESLPLEGLDEVIATQVGISVSSASSGSGFSIRGGDISETEVIVDGMSLMNERTQVAISSINMTAVDEIEVLTGGFDAEYGNIRSGVINITTKEDFNSFSFRGDFRMSPPAKKHFGPSPFSPQGPFWKVYAGEKAFTGVMREDVESGGYPFEFSGWNQVAINNAKDNVPSNDYTPQEALEIWKWRHRNIEYANQPDYVADFTFSGPTPFKKIGYMFSQRYENTQYYMPLSRKAYTNSVTQFKLIYSPSDKLKIRFNNLYNYEDGTGGISGGYTPSKSMFNGSRQSVVSMSYLANDPKNLFLESTYNPIQNYSYVSSIALSYIFSKSTYLNLWAEMFYDRVVQEPIYSRDTTGIKKIGNVWYDETPKGQPDSYGEQWDQFNQCNFGGLGRGQNHSQYKRLKLSGSIVSQINKYNHLKSGFELMINRFEERELFNMGGNIYPRDQMPSQYFYYTSTPMRASVYIQDKLEFEGMIANVGLRMDYYTPNENPFDLSDPFNTPLEASYYQQMGTFDSLRVNKKTGKVKFSPRVGISHPISERSKIYFNYGHFYQIPDKSYYFNVAPEGSGHLNLIPNLLLDWPKTIQYEVGYEHNIANQFLLHLGAYYKDVSNEVVELDIRSGQLGTGTVQATTWSNNQYRDIRGIELRFEKNQGRYFTSYANFEYSVWSTGRTGLFGIYQDQQLMQEQRNRYDQQRSFPAPSLQLNVEFHTPSNFGPNFLGGYPLGAWRTSAIYGWSDGGMALYDADAPLSDRHWMEFTDWSNTDLMIQKVIKMKSAKLTLYSQITNLFNQKRLYNVQDIEYKSSLHLPWETGEQHGNDKYGDYKQDYLKLGWYSWTQFLNPRDFFMGLRISF